MDEEDTDEEDREDEDEEREVQNSGSTSSLDKLLRSIDTKITVKGSKIGFIKEKG